MRMIIDAPRFLSFLLGAYSVALIAGGIWLLRMPDTSWLLLLIMPGCALYVLWGALAWAAFRDDR